MNKKTISLPGGATNICIAKQNGEIVKFNIGEVKEIFSECDEDSSAVDAATLPFLKFVQISATEAELKSYKISSKQKAVEVPAKIILDGKEFTVTSIGKEAFCCEAENGNKALVSIVLPSTIKNIGYRAFRGCTGLTVFEIPSSVTSIGDYAFGGCIGITVFEIPSSVTSIGNSAFSGCHALTNIEIPSCVTSIGDYAFFGCGKLSNIEVASDNPNYSSENGVLYNKKKTEIIKVPQTLKGSFAIPLSVMSIGKSAFSGCSGLTSIEIPSSVTSIGERAFEYCRELTSIEIPPSVTSIGNSAFSGCHALTNIEIPSSVTSIGESAFSDCSKLSNIEVASDNPNYSSENGVLYNKKKTEIIKVPQTLKGSFAIPSSVMSIGKSAFSRCSGLTSIEIPSSVTSIGNYAFYDCSGLTSIEVPSSVTRIEYYSFYNENLRLLTLPSALKYSQILIGHCTKVEEK